MGEIVLATDQMPDLLPMRSRTPGLHVSAIIKDLCIQLGHLSGSGDDLPAGYRELGKAFEFALIRMLEIHTTGRYVQIGEIEKDGIFMTPDLIDVRDEAVVEVKVAWMSSAHDPAGPKFWRYWTQVKAYCWAMEMTRGVVRVCHVNGDYKRGEGVGGPVYHEWVQDFSGQELAENWQMLKSHGEANRERLEEGRGVDRG